MGSLLFLYAFDIFINIIWILFYFIMHTISVLTADVLIDCQKVTMEVDSGVATSVIPESLFSE